MFFARPLPCRYDWPVVTRSQLSSAFLLLALAGLLYMTGLLLAPYAQPIAWALVLAVVFHPAYRTLLGVMPNYPGLAAATLTLLIVALVVVPGLLEGLFNVNRLMTPWLHRAVEPSDAAKTAHKLADKA